LKKVLVTGCAGFIGLHLVRAISSPEVTVVGVDNRSRAHESMELEEVKGSTGARFIEADLTRIDTWNGLDDDFDIVIHCAAINGTKTFYERPYDVVSINTTLVMNMIDWHRANSPSSRIVFLSSSEVYGSLPFVPFPTPEDVLVGISDLTNPRWSYATSKIVGEALLQAYANETGAEIVIIRPHNIYGPRMGQDHVIPEFIQRILGKENPFKIFGGANQRSFCYVDDFVLALWDAAVTDSAVGEVINLGNDTEEIAITDLARQLADVAGVDPPPKIEILDAPTGSPMRRLPDLSKARSLLKFKPSVTLRDGLERTFDWYRAQ
jgi:nucleoside-diphosphate-sugar epimerase